MAFFGWLFVFAVLALVIENGVTYFHAHGTPAQRLAVCWSGSMTIVLSVYGMLATAVMYGLDFVSQMSGDPTFAQWASELNKLIPPQYRPLVTLGLMFAATLGRFRTLPKGTP